MRCYSGPFPPQLLNFGVFLGLTGYYRKFIKHYGLIARPLTGLLRTKHFVWTPTAQQAFNQLKQAMVTAPVLAIPDFSQPFIVETDASDTGIGAVLIQRDQPVAFLSKALGPQHQKLSIYEKEFLALIMAVERWRTYLQRQEFIIRTDHQSLSYLTEQHLHSDMQRKAMTRLMGLQFKVVYRKGKENIVADSLSRVGHLCSTTTVSHVQPVWLQELLNSYNTDLAAQDLLAKLALHSPDEAGFSLSQGIIRYNNKIWVANNSALQTKLINSFHSTAVGGHSGSKGTYHRISQLFYWKGLKSAVEDFVRQCSVCQHAKHSNTHPAGLLQPLPIPVGAWQDITMDFVEGLPSSEGYNCILVVVDRYTKYAHFIPLKHPFTAQLVARAVLDNVVRLHGFPKTIVSDRDRIFLSAFWKELFALFGTGLLRSTAYHPQTDGQSERVNQCLEMYLRCAVHDNPKRWKHCISLAEIWYNTCLHSSLGCSPFKALYGYEPDIGFSIAPIQDTPTEALTWVTERDAHMQQLKDNLARAQNRMKQLADRHRVDRQFQVGEQVLLKLQPYAQSSVVNRPYPKLAFKFFGPFAVLQRVGSAAYRLKLPDGCLIHPVFHVSQLKPFTPNYTPVFADPKMLLDFSTTDLQPERVLERRLVKKGSKAVPQVLVKWTHLPVDSATWEDWYVLQARFPSFVACGQATAAGGKLSRPVCRTRLND